MARQRVHCPKCNGTGKVTRFGRDRVLGKRVKMEVACLNCNGTGIVEKIKFDLGPKLVNKKILRQVQKDRDRQKEEILSQNLEKLRNKEQEKFSKEQQRERLNLAINILLFLVLVLIVVGVYRC
ncbi:MAG: hypothetical protein DWQ02_22030 [Bacteroidetes bacterium]|nr:MAG: hypothetical protein DWQ02_22030 [Bacteroidota bacterium]